MGKERLIDALHQDDKLSVCIALIGLDHYPGEDSARAVAEFLDSDENSTALRQVATVALGRLGEKGKEKLEEILSGEDETFVEYALLGYEFVDGPVKDMVERHLWSGNKRIVEAAALVYGRLWPDEVVDVLGPLFGHVNEGVRCMTLPYVFVETEDPAAINHLTLVYRRAGDRLREHILDAIRRGMRKNPELMHKTIAIPAALLRNDETDEEDMENLGFMLKSASHLERWNAAHMVVSKPFDSVRHILGEMLESDDAIVVRRALAYILDNDPKGFLSSIFDLLQHKEAEVRIRAVIGLVKTSIPEEMIMYLLGERQNNNNH